VFKFLTIALLLMPLSSWAEQIDWTRKGYFVVKAPDGEFVSRHISEQEAAMSAANHAFNSGNTGTLIYKVESPDYDVRNIVPKVATTEPPPPPPPPVDTGEMLDPNTVFACDGGEAGTTVEPTGSDSAGGLWVDGQPDPVKSLRRLEQIAEQRADGVDYRLCEGAVFEDQTLTIRKSGDVGAWNRIQIANAPDDVLEKKNYRSLDGWRVEDEDYVVVGCYKILNGVPRPCMDSYPICEEGIATKCLDPLDYSLRSFYSPS